MNWGFLGQIATGIGYVAFLFWITRGRPDDRQTDGFDLFI